jgi:glutathione S-transferase
MTEPVLRIFSYLPNPRVWKAQIAARLCGVEVEVIGAKPGELGAWLWDFNARPLTESERTADSPHARGARRGFAGTLYKTDEFLQAHPFGTVPAAFSPDGSIGVFESNSILRAVARRGATARQLYGHDDYEASRIDSFLDANLVLAREAQVYLLGIKTLSVESHARMAAAYEFYLSGIEAALAQGTPYIAGQSLSIADISFVCDFAQFLREGHSRVELEAQDLKLISHDGPTQYPHAYRHMLTLAATPDFSMFMGTYLDWYIRREEGRTD